MGLYLVDPGRPTTEALSCLYMVELVKPTCATATLAWVPLNPSARG